jgi:hypothetical protein
MANRDNPCGFRMSQGIGSQHVCKQFIVDSSSGTALFMGDVVGLNAVGSVRPAAADIGVAAAGICIAVYDSNGVSCGAPGSSVSTKYLTASVAGYALVALAIPGVVFIAQDDGSVALTGAAVAATTDHVAGVGSTTTAVSAHELNATIGGLQFRIIGLHPAPGNAWGANAELQVVFNESAFGVSAAASV